MADSLVLGTLKVLLSANTEAFNSALTQAGASFEKWTSETGSKLTALGSSTTALGGALTAGLTAPILGAVGGLVALATQAASTGEEIFNNATAAGVSTAAYQELHYALGQVSKLTEEQVNTALSNLTLKIGEAAGGSKTAVAALSELGFTQEEIASGTISTEDAFRKMTEAMQQAETPAAAMALAGDLVGSKMGKNLAGALRESGGEIDGLRQKAKDLGLVMSTEAVAGGEAFNDSLDTLKGQFGALGREVGAAFLPILTGSLIPFIQNTVLPALLSFSQMLAGLVTWFANLPGPIQAAIGVVVGLAAAIGPVLVVVGTLITAFGTILPIIGTVGAVLGALASGPVLIIGAAIAALAVIWQVWGDDIVRITSEAIGAVKTWLVDTFQGIANAVTTVLTGLQTAWTVAKDAIVGVATAIYTGVYEWLVTQFQAVIDTVVTILTALQTAWTVAKDAVIVVATAIYTGIYEWLVTQFQPVIEMVTTILMALQTAWTVAKDAVIVTATALYTGIKTWLVDKLTEMVGLIQTGLTTMKTAWDTAKTLVVGAAQALYEGVKSWLVDKFNAIVDGIKSKIEAVTGFFKDMKDKVVGNSFVPDMIAAIGKEFGTLDSKMVAPTRRGTDTTTNLFDDMSRKVQGHMQGMFDKLGSSTGNFLGGGGGGVWGSIVSGGMSAVFGPGGILAGLASQGLAALGDLVFKGLGKIAGFFKDIFGGPSAKELAGREIVDEFENNIGAMLTEQQKIEAGGEEWKATIIGVRDKYIEMGRDGGLALTDVKRLWDASKAGPDAVQAVIEEIKRKMSTMPSDVETAFSAFPDEINIPVNFNVGQIPDQDVNINVNVNAPEIPDIPSLGEGGIVHSPTLALIGESGPEAVVPLSRGYGMGGDVGAVARRLEGLIDRLEHVLPVAIRDAIQMA